MNFSKIKKNANFLKIIFLILSFLLLIIYLIKNIFIFNVSLSFNYLPKKPSDPAVIFQSDDFNYGIRYEIVNSQMGEIIALDGKGNYGAQIIYKVNKNKKYSFNSEIIKIFNICLIKTYFDGQLASNYSGQCNIKFSNIKFGNGFDMKRPFQGLIYEKLIQQKKYDPNKFKDLFSIIFTKLLFVSIDNYSNLLILLLTILTFLYRNIFINSMRNIFSFIDTKIRTSNGFFLLTLNITLCFLFPPFLSLFSALTIFYLIGINIFLNFKIAKFNDDYDNFTITIFHGFSLVTFIGSFFIYLNLSIYKAFFCIFIGLVFSSLINKKEILPAIKNQITSNIINFKYLNIIFSVFLIIFSFFIVNDFSSFYRVGPDIVSYANMSQFLIEGKTFEDAYNEIAFLDNLLISEIIKYNQLVMDWSFANFFRYGVSFYNAFIHILSNNFHVYSTIFVSFLIPYILSIFLMYSWFKKSQKKIFIFAIFAIFFNSNFLNLYLEGFYANIFFVPFFIFFIHLVKKFCLSDKQTNTFIYYSFLITILNIFLIYPEGLFFMIIPILFLLLFINLFLNDFNLNKRLIYLFLFLILIFLVLFLSAKGKYIINFIFSSLLEGGTNGFNQPHWALPSEILGLNNIYNISYLNFPGKLIGYHWFDILSLIFFSGFILYIGIIFIKNKFYLKFQFESSIFIYIFLILIYALIFSRSNNYIYYKAYATSIPILVSCFFIVLNSSKFFKTNITVYINTLVSTLVFLSGIYYLILYIFYSSSISSNEISLYKKIDDYDKNNYLVVLDNVPKLSFIYSSFFKTEVIEKNNSCTFKYDSFPYNRLLNKKVIFLTADKKNDYYKNINLIYKNDLYTLFESGATFNEFLIENCEYR